MEAVRDEVDRVIAASEAAWLAPDPASLVTARASLATIGDLPDDLKDHPVLSGAMALSCSFLLSTDRRSFAHGRAFGPVVCWHPDTFLTEYFKADLEMYKTAVEECALLTPPIKLLP